MEHYYSGNGVSFVSEAGEVRVPQFVRRTVERRSGLSEVILGSHEADPCLVAYDLSHRPSLFAELERRRLSEERAGILPEPHYARLRRVFGTAEQVHYDEEGGLELPLVLRWRARIDRSALFIGAGETFEIWDPATAMGSPDPDLRDLAAQVLRESHSQLA